MYLIIIQKINFTKEEFKIWSDEYFGKVKQFLMEKRKDRLEDFVKGLPLFMNYLFGMFEDLSFYTSENFGKEHTVIMSYYKFGNLSPTFLYFMDGLTELKM